MTLDDIKARCRIEDGHWIWKGAKTSGRPRVWAPDFTLHNGQKKAQTGRRAIWHVKTGAPIPEGHRVFGTCDRADCLAPGHSVCEAPGARGVTVAASGKLKGVVKRIAANRQSGRKRAVLTPALIAEINTSTETGEALAQRMNRSRQTISKVRSGKYLCFEPVGGLLTGLLAASRGEIGLQPAPQAA